MGCVLGKRATFERCRRRKRKNDERRDSESAAAAVDTGEEPKIEEVSAAAAGRRSVSVATPEFRLRIGADAAGAEAWPSWLSAVAGDEIKGWKPRRANTFEKLDKIGQGTYSNVYKARDLISGKVVALKKVRFDNFEPEAVRFMAREILVLRRLNHPNVIKLEGLVISRMSSSLYLVFEYMEHDLASLAAVQTTKFSEAQKLLWMILKLLIERMFGLEGLLNDPGSGWKLVYVDFESDVLFVGDDPWEEFVGCVRCIRILSPCEVKQMGEEGMQLLNSAAAMQQDLVGGAAPKD